MSLVGGLIGIALGSVTSTMVGNLSADLTGDTYEIKLFLNDFLQWDGGGQAPGFFNRRSFFGKPPWALPDRPRRAGDFLRRPMQMPCA